MTKTRRKGCIVFQSLFVHAHFVFLRAGGGGGGVHLTCTAGKKHTRIFLIIPLGERHATELN